MEIPRDVLVAGALAALIAEGFSPENPHLPKLAADWVDSTGNVLVPAIVAAIEAWESRPWDGVSSSDSGYAALDDVPPSAWDLLGIDPGPTDGGTDGAAERERFARFAEEYLRDGNGIAYIIRSHYEEWLNEQGS